MINQRVESKKSNPVMNMLTAVTKTI